MKIVIDTSIIIDHVRGGTKWNDFKENLDEEDQLFIPTIVIFELYSGDSTKNPRKLKNLTDFVKIFKRIELTEDIAREAGVMYRDLKKSFQVPDYIIAASAISINGQVLTLNQKHFKQVPGLNIYDL